MEDWSEIRALFERCLDLDPEGRAGLLLEARAEVRIEVEDLLLAHEEGEGLFREGDGGRQLGELAELRPKVGERIGGFLLVEELGQGGTGTVYRAEQARPRRSVAIKILSSAFIGPRNQQRFQLEIELLSRLRHEGIAQVFSAGFADLRTGLGEVRVPYYVREFVEDSRTLDLWRDEADRSERDVIRVVLDVARAMQHAHERGVVHQDLKPQNVLIDIHGRIKIIDFGSGRLLSDSDSKILKLPHRMGTPAYMAPEQFAADSGSADTRIDVHAIGLIAFELLAGEPVFADAPGEPRVLESRICAPQRPRLRDKVPGVSRELDAILAKAMHVAPERRYGGAGSLAGDLERYLERKTVDAYGGGIFYEVRAWSRRNRLAAMVAALLIVSVVGLVVAVQTNTARALTAEHALLEKSREETESTLRAIDLAIHAITRLPGDMSFAVNDPVQQRAYWLRLAAANLQRIEEVVPINREIALALGRAYAAVATEKLGLQESVEGTEIAPDAVDRAISYVDLYAADSSRGDAGGLLDTIEFEIGLQSKGRLSTNIGLLLARAALEHAVSAPADMKAAVGLRFLLMEGDGLIRQGDVDGGLELYRAELARQAGVLPVFGEDVNYPMALLALRRRVAAIESFQGRAESARRLLRETIDLHARVPTALRTPDVEFEVAMARLLLGSSLSQDGEWVEGERLITEAKAAMEQLGDPSSAAAHTKALVNLRVAQFLLDRGRASSDSPETRDTLREALAIASGVRWRSASGLVGDPSIVRLLIDKEALRIVDQATSALRQ